MQKKLTITLKEETWRSLANACKASNLSKGEFIRGALEKALNEAKNNDNKEEEACYK